MTEATKPVFNERIQDIYDLHHLNKYACQKIKFHKDWYMDCMNCPDKKCKTGRQVEVILDHDTMPAETDPVRKQIVDIFGAPDPVFKLLQTFSKLRPPSVYAKVNSWRRRFPDLEMRYHMIEKVRFLWTKQYESMTIPDILQELYPGAPTVYAEPEKETKAIDVASMHPSSIISHTELAPNSKIITLKPDIDETAEGDSISLEDFLQEVGVSEAAAEDIPDEKPVTEFKKGDVVQVVSESEDGKKTAAKCVATSDGSPTSMQGSASDLDILLAQLESDKATYQLKIRELDKQIEAVMTVIQLMAK